jgi:hypothetical protein
VVVASVVEQEVAGELQKRQRGRGGTCGGAEGGVEREQGEASESICSRSFLICSRSLLIYGRARRSIRVLRGGQGGEWGDEAGSSAGGGSGGGAVVLRRLVLECRGEG